MRRHECIEKVQMNDCVRGCFLREGENDRQRGTRHDLFVAGLRIVFMFGVCSCTHIWCVLIFCVCMMFLVIVYFHADISVHVCVCCVLESACECVCVH